VACFYCHECGNMKDGDYDMPEEHPWKAGDLVCEECFQVLEYEAKMCAEEDAHEDD